ncbi:LysR family transcriptional regulator [Roseibium polysiphoniae]|uniref:LysR family transcriptional regulator n=2 Tax=Roseibium polysiphoniae TaxID=2571221 RepID=A0A944CDC1_9HYPH|nr:LysR family transcriptional regulator [Roseibium polysiphoniae]
MVFSCWKANFLLLWKNTGRNSPRDLMLFFDGLCNKGIKLEITWLEDLIELDAARNFSVAAAARNITQPAFSRRIRALENWVGTQLIDRSAYPVKLTQAGEIVLENARTLSKEIYRLRDECLDLSSPGADTLSVSAMHSIVLSIYPEYALNLQRLIGPFATRMTATDYYDCLESLSLGRCELAICYAHILGPKIQSSGQFQTQVLMKDSLALVTTPDLAEEMEAALAAPSSGQTLPLVSYSSGCFLGKMQEVLTKHYNARGLGFHTVFENSMSEAVKRMILVGAGIGWLPESVIKDELKHGALSVLTGSAAELELDVALMRKHAAGSPLMERIWDLAVAGAVSPE